MALKPRAAPSFLEALLLEPQAALDTTRDTQKMGVFLVELIRASWMLAVRWQLAEPVSHEVSVL